MDRVEYIDMGDERELQRRLINRMRQQEFKYEGDATDSDPEWELGSNGQSIVSEKNSIKQYIQGFKNMKFLIDGFDIYFKMGSPRNLHGGAICSLGLLNDVFSRCSFHVNLLLKKGSQGPKMETILQMHDHAAKTISEIKAELAALD